MVDKIKSVFILTMIAFISSVLLYLANAIVGGVL